MIKDIEIKIANKVKENGGKTYYVGGYVRDLLLGKENKDIDIEVHGIEPNKLLEILSEFGKPLSYGKSFGIYSLEGTNIDIAMPRIERNIGSGHKDFEVYVDPYIDIKKAIERRDFTINAIYKDVLTSEIIDPFNGIKDLENKTIRHINETSFVEDPLRVLRACQFASRFNFEISPHTIELCSSIDITSLSKQRVEEELKKALLQSDNPSIFFIYLNKMNQLDYYFKDCNLDYIDKANKYIDKINNKYAYLLSTLSINSTFEITKFTNQNDIYEYVENMRTYINSSYSNDYELFKIFNNVIDINDYIYLRMLVNNEDDGLFVLYDKYKELMSKPYVMGNDLIERGYKPGEYFNAALNYAKDLRILGIDKQEAIELVIKYIEG